MSTLVIKDTANADVTFTKLSSDATRSRFCPLAKVSGNDDSMALAIEQKLPALGSGGSQKTMVKFGHDKLVVGATGKASVKSLYVSVLISKSADFSDVEVNNAIAYALNTVNGQKADLIAGVVI